MTDNAVAQQAALTRVLSESELTAGAAETDQPAAPDIRPDRARQFAGPGLSRMRTDWPAADRAKLGEIEFITRRQLQERFKGAFDLMDQIFLAVREPAMEDGRIRMGIDGRPRWVCDEHGNPVEDWAGLGDEQRKRFLHAITVHLFEWQQVEADVWGEAMFAKVAWEEKFSNGYLALPGWEGKNKPTIDDRTQTGVKNSIEERYFAVFCAVLSKKAEAVVRAMIRIQKLLETSYPA